MNDNTSPKPTDRLPFRLTDLHPAVRPQYAELIRMNEEYAKAGGMIFLPFEGFRTPERQIELHAEKRTWTGPWKSAHQWGLAVDFVPKINGKWSWDAPEEAWALLKVRAIRCGLSVPIEKDKVHVEARELWFKLRALT